MNESSPMLCQIGFSWNLCRKEAERFYEYWSEPVRSLLSVASGIFEVPTRNRITVGTGLPGMFWRKTVYPGRGPCR